MKKKLLFVIPSLEAGGGEKSLVNLLNCIDYNLYEVDLVLFSSTGLFLKQVPSEVTLLDLGNEYACFTKSISSSFVAFLKQGKIKLAVARLLYSLKINAIKNKGIAEQYAWRYLQKSISLLPSVYDVAIGFLEKSSIYFVVDCVNAKNKIGFIHNDYDQLDLEKNFDLPYFKKLTTIATVSDQCAEVLKVNFPTEQNKVVVIKNIVSTALIHKLANDTISIDTTKPILLSVGRLHPQKGFDFAIAAATILKEKNTSFKWYIIGEGAEREALENAIVTNNLQDFFILLGLKENPYPYIKAATICVQTSRYEGKSIAIDEAKILCKPILVTNFTTAKDQITNEQTGLIVNINPEAIADGIITLLTDVAFRTTLIANLKRQDFGTESEIDKLYKLFTT